MEEHRSSALEGALPDTVPKGERGPHTPPLEVVADSTYACTMLVDDHEAAAHLQISCKEIKSIGSL